MIEYQMSAADAAVYARINAMLASVTDAEAQRARDALASGAVTAAALVELLELRAPAIKRK